MILTIALGLLGVLCIMLRPMRLIIKGPFAGFSSKAYASMFFCLAGIAAAAQRESLNWQAAALLFGFCLATIGDVLLAMEPIMKHPERDKNYAFIVGGVPFLLAHGLNLAVLLSHGATDWRLLPLAFVLPALYAALWGCKALRLGKAGVPLLLYALVLGAMLWAAAQAALTDMALGKFVLPAAALFAVSDTALFCSTFGRKPLKGPVFSWLVMLPYYLAQTLMACAVALI